MKPELLDESEVEMWRRHPITQKVFKRLKEVLDSRVKKMLRSEETIDRAAMNAAEARGFTQAMDIVSNADFFDEDQDGK